MASVHDIARNDNSNGATYGTARHVPGHLSTPLLQMLLAAGLLQLVYVTTFTWRFQWPRLLMHVPYAFQWSDRLVCMMGLGVAFTLYVAAHTHARQAPAPDSLPLVIGAGLMFAATLSAMYPLTSNDIFAYIMRSHIFVDLGANPYTHAPVLFPTDTLLAGVDYPQEPMPHGPLWVVIGSVATIVGHQHLLPTFAAFKFLGFASYALNVVLLVPVLQRLCPERLVSGVLQYAWNPLVLFELVGNGHNDGWMTAALLASVLALSYRRYTLGAVFLTLGILVKFVVLLAAPVFAIWLWRQPAPRLVRLRRVSTAVVTGVVLTIALYAPFWQGLQTLTVVHRTQYMTGSPLSVIIFFLEKWVPEAHAKPLAIGCAFVLFGAIVVYLCHRVRSPLASAVTSIHRAIGAYLVIACLWLQPWYITWLVPLTPLDASTRSFRWMVTLCVIVETTTMVGYGLLSRWGMS